MGWWKINDELGGIDPTHEGPGGLWNAIGGLSSPENHYNGDEPSDYMADAVESVLAALNATPTVAQLHALFFEHRNDGLKRRKPLADLITLVEIGWGKVTEAYHQEWKRVPYVEEKEAVFNFVTYPREAEDGRHAIL